MASTPRSGGKKNIPTSAVSPISWSWKTNSVTMPKLPPPPRSAQNSSVFSVRLARTTCDGAVAHHVSLQFRDDVPGPAGRRPDVAE
jgi:hypothetical protein